MAAAAILWTGGGRAWKGRDRSGRDYTIRYNLGHYNVTRLYLSGLTGRTVRQSMTQSFGKLTAAKRAAARWANN